tara:strand:+ start:1961 stop:2758 length:798 start_codon:yes stop_codon:yes gene_type:complete
MARLFILLIFCSLALSSCRYWVLYEFAEQFCELEEYIPISWINEPENRQVKIGFNEPVLDRSILLRYLNAEPFESVNKAYLNTQKLFLSEDSFAIRQTHFLPAGSAAPFQFKLAYHPIDEHVVLLESAYLDSKLSQLFSPALIEPILRSLCSDDYDLSFKQLNMRFSLSTLPKQSLPSLQKLITVFGQAEETIVDDTGDQTLRYEFDFLTQEKQQSWQVQHKPITMLFGFDSHSQLKNLYIHYHKYSYWLDVESLSGRLLVIRSE